MSFLEKLSNFKDNCWEGPIIPVTLAGCLFGAIYLPLKYMPASVITTSEKVKFAAIILASTYVIVGCLSSIKSLILEDNRDAISRMNPLQQCVDILGWVILYPFISLNQ